MIKRNRVAVIFGAVFVILVAISLSSLCSFAQEPNTNPTKAQSQCFTDPAKADHVVDFQVQGEYVGRLDGMLGKTKVAWQVIAIGDGEFNAVVFGGGLPGAGFDGNRVVVPYRGNLTTDGSVVFDGKLGVAKIKKGRLEVFDTNGVSIGSLLRIERESMTLGQKPPQNAIVLFDGRNVNQWSGGRKTDGGLLMEGTTSNRTFHDHKIHLEFRLPFMPGDKGQARGNSGVYVQGRFEVQLLDSFGLKGANNECGGIYTVRDCTINMCYPPLTWQTYDIEFTAAKYEGQGKDEKLVAAPRMTVFHNGIRIHNDVELPTDRGTTAAPVGPGPAPGPIHLQNHNCPVVYRNIWVVEY